MCARLYQEQPSLRVDELASRVSKLESQVQIQKEEAEYLGNVISAKGILKKDETTSTLSQVIRFLRLFEHDMDEFQDIIQRGQETDSRRYIEISNIEERLSQIATAVEALNKYSMDVSNQQEIIN